MGRENGQVSTETITKASLKMIRRMVMGYLIGRTEIDIRGSLLMMQDKEKDR